MSTVLLFWLVFLMGAVVGLGVGYALREHSESKNYADLCACGRRGVVWVSNNLYCSLCAMDVLPEDIYTWLNIKEAD